jgi:chloramphenicol 3-O-phosphotransferase
MEPVIILLSGSINSGKTAVAKQLVQLLPRTAHVEVDDLREFIRFMPLEEAIPLNLQNAVAVTRNFVAYGLNVVITSPLPQDDYDFLTRELQPLGVPIHCVTLNPDLAVALTNRGTRELTGRERARLPYHYETSINNPTFGVVIDNARLTPEETARQIVARVKEDGNAVE